jgi:hypothetical protein
MFRIPSDSVASSFGVTHTILVDKKKYEYNRNLITLIDDLGDVLLVKTLTMFSDNTKTARLEEMEDVLNGYYHLSSKDLSVSSIDVFGLDQAMTLPFTDHKRDYYANLPEVVYGTADNLKIRPPIQGNILLRDVNKDWWLIGGGT